MAIELATGYVQLVPSARGITQGLQAELGAPVVKAAEDAANTAGGRFSSAFASAGKTAAIGLAVGVTALVAAGGALYKVGADFDSAFDTIRAGTGETGKNLAGLDNDFRKVFGSIPTSMGPASEAITELHQGLNLTGPPLQGLSKQVLELSRITNTDLKGNIAGVTEVMNNWGVSAKDQGGKLDELFRTSQKTGVSVADLSSTMARMGSPLRQVGLSFEQSAALVGLLGKAGVDVGSIMPALSKSIAAAAKEGKSAKDVFSGVFDRIRKAPTDTAAASAAIAVFGARAGPNLAGLIRQGKISYEDLAKTIAAGGDTILGAARDTNDFSEKWKIFTNKVLLVLEPIAARVFGGMSRAIDIVTAGASKFALGFSALIAAFKEGDITSDGFVGVMERIGVTLRQVVIDVQQFWQGTLLPVFRQIGDFVSANLGPVLGGLAALVLAVVVPAFVSWAAGAIAAAAATLAAAAPVIALAAVIAALGFGIIWAYQHVQIFHDIVNAVADFFTKQFVPLMGQVGTDIVDVWNRIYAVGKTVFDAIGSVVQGFVNGPVKFLTDQIGSFSTWWSAHWDEIKTVFTVIFDAIALYVAVWWDYLKGVFQVAVDAILPIVQIAWQVLQGTFHYTFDLITGVVRIAWDQMTGFFTTAKDAILGIVGVFLDLLTGHWGRAWSDIKDTVSTVLGDITGTIGKVLGDIVGTVEKIAGDIFSAALGIGRAIVNGVVGGIRAIAGDIWDAIRGAIEDGLSHLPGPLKSVAKKVLNFDLGGVVPGPVGKPQVAIVHGGERVLTPEQQSAMAGHARLPVASSLGAGNGWSLSLTGAFGAGPEDIAASVVTQVRRMELLAGI